MQSILSPIHAIATLTGWRRRFTAFALGICATLTLPPVFFFPLIFVAYGGLYLMLTTAQNARAGARDGWWWGWGFYMSGLYWFCIALLTDAEKFAWLIPFTLFGLTAVIALYPSIACALFARVRQPGITGLLQFAAIWTLMEIARGHLLSGFPWNLPAYALNVSDVTLQSAALVGAYGLSFWVVLIGAAPALLILKERRAMAVILLLAASFACVTGWGYMRLVQADRVPESERYVEGVKLRLVQANIAQHHKWDPRRQMDGLQEYVRLSHLPGLDQVTHIIWPETAIPFVTRPNSGLTYFIGQAIPEGKHLITGTLRDERGEDWKIWNSLLSFDHEGKIVGVYDKSKLVPFGEFLPGRWLIPEGWKTPVGDTDFSRGEGMQTLDWPGLPPVSPLICYEVIFPERTVGDGERPQWLLSVTNDAWFGNSSGPYQHMEMARMRAVEQGLALVRVANTGITISTDSYGRIKSRLDLGVQGISDIRLQKPQQHATTYSENKKIVLPLLIIITILLILVGNIKRTINKFRLQVV